MNLVVSVGLILMAHVAAQEFTRGVGIYPGDPKENAAPSMRLDNTYRNLALHRAAYQSSSYDFNLTAQLITDGIKSATLPRWISVSTKDGGVLPRSQREWPLDDNWVTTVDLKGIHAWIQVELAGAQPPVIDRLDIDASVQPMMESESWTCIVKGSDDGQTWKQIGRADDVARPNGAIKRSVLLQEPSASHFYRLEFEAGRNFTWHIGEISFFNRGQRVHVGGPYDFTSAWKSAGNGEEWVYVDLGASCTFDRVVLSWLRRATEASLQTSEDAVNWQTIQPVTADDMKLATPAKARYVRVLMTKPESPDGYILSEFEVYGRGGPVPESDWRLERVSQVSALGPAVSKPGFYDKTWLAATVPGTELASYFNAGAIPDPGFGNNQTAVSDSFFYSDFWYRHEFVPAATAPGRHVWLNFDGINWKADVYLNGAKLGRIEGGFMRARFDVTNLLHPGQKNALAVLVEKNATPGSVKQKTFDNPDKNGGPLGADNPTFHASIGWDWIPTVRGRNTGIWNKVYFSESGPVTIENPFVNTTSIESSSAGVSIEVTLTNHDTTPVNGTLHGRFGDQAFEQPVTLSGSTSKVVKTSLQIQNPRLWWPNAYGDPNLYKVELNFGTSDTKTFQAGIRQFTYSEDGDALRIFINGRRLIPRGGNWGFSEFMLRYRAREYDVAVRYHREMNFNMIRNWVGQVGENAFYDACDKYGIVVWQDFWLANPWDGPDPNDDTMFLNNARDTILRVRSHPSMGLYVGRNEGYPPKTLEDGFRSMIAELHPGLHYIPSSADGVVGGRGPYRAMSPKYYFEQRATTKFHSEMGMPNIVSLDSLKAMMPQSDVWPQGEMWGIHDFSLNGAQGGSSFIERIKSSYGGANNAAEWVELAQFVNYEGYRAMYEAQSKYRMGLLIWMSHPCWPTFVWQTYDYYFEPTAAYFGAKKASEPLHIQWNPSTDNVEVVNYSAGAVSGLTAKVQLLNMDGSVKWEKSASLDSVEDSTATPIKIEYPTGLTPVHFVKLTLTRAGNIVSENFYWRGLVDGDYRALRELPKVTVDASTHVDHEGPCWKLTTDLTNNSNAPALMVKLKAVREKSGDRILPAIYSDNYIALMPGERRTIQTEIANADTRGETPRIIVEGFNVN